MEMEMEREGEERERGRGLGYGEELDFEDESGAAGDAGDGAGTVAEFGGDVDLPFVTGMHLLHGDDPTLDEVAEAECRGCAAEAAVEFFAVDGAAGVVGCDDAIAIGTRCLAIPLADHTIVYTAVEGMHPLLLGLGGKPFTILLHIFLFCHILLGFRAHPSLEKLV